MPAPVVAQRGAPAGLCWTHGCGPSGGDGGGARRLRRPLAPRSACGSTRFPKSGCCHLARCPCLAILRQKIWGLGDLMGAKWVCELQLLLGLKSKKIRLYLCSANYTTGN